MSEHYAWWEKTVEYVFILQIKSLVDFATPRSGVEERAADGIFASDAKLVLIEFKRNHTEMSSGRKKFLSFDEASETLRTKDAHHFIVYGDAPAPQTHIGSRPITGHREYSWLTRFEPLTPRLRSSSCPQNLFAKLWTTRHEAMQVAETTAFGL